MCAGRLGPVEAWIKARTRWLYYCLCAGDDDDDGASMTLTFAFFIPLISSRFFSHILIGWQNGTLNIFCFFVIHDPLITTHTHGRKEALQGTDSVILVLLPPLLY